MLSMRVLALALVAATAQAWDLNCNNGPCQLSDAKGGTAMPTTNSAALHSFTASAASSSGPAPTSIAAGATSSNGAASPQVTGMAGAVAGAIVAAALAL